MSRKMRGTPEGKCHVLRRRRRTRALVTAKGSFWVKDLGLYFDANNKAKQKGPREKSATTSATKKSHGTKTERSKIWLF